MSNLKQGSRGPAVAALQAALNAQLYPSPDLAEDGIYGCLTRQAVLAFQRRTGIDADGIAGQQTLTALGLPILGSTYTHRVRIHFRSLTLTDVAFSLILATSQEIYAQYGIKLEYATGMSLGLTDAEALKFAQVDSECNWDASGSKYGELQELGGNIPGSEIGVFYALSLQGVNGCGGHLPNRPACFIGAGGTRWTTAHEIGHVLLTSGFDHDTSTPGINESHTADAANLMWSSSAQGFGAVPMLTDRQVRTMKGSPCCVPC